MTIPEKAVEWIKKIAADNSHGYDQSSRWGPDYDCSSLVISAYKAAGVPLTCTYTGNMRNDMLNKGFAPVPTANKQTGAGLLPGDVLLNETHHTAMYIGNGKIVHAAGNESGGATGGKTGDQNSREICEANYFNFPWDCILRYSRKEEVTTDKPTNSNTYIVQSGDSFWSIAQKTLGDGSRYAELAAFNGMKPSAVIHPGDVLLIPTDGQDTRTIQITVTSDTYELLDIMAKGWNKTIGEVIDELMKDAV
ncbi:MAG: LysM peptidoglycan-binding domain-containing protein [Bacteroidales bacterium]|nr:LysM peptidoglycan-binding domain-containing protein [Bacteroidales bacterium]